MFQYITSIGGCVVQASRYDFTPTELVEMIGHAGVNRVFQFSPTVKEYLEFAKSGVPEPRLFDALKGLRQLTYGGMTIAKEWEDWALAQEIPITVCSYVALSSSISAHDFSRLALALLRPVRC